MKGQQAFKFNYWLAPQTGCDSLYDLHGVVADLNGDYVWAVGEDGHVCKSTDGGVTWTGESATSGIALIVYTLFNRILLYAFYCIVCTLFNCI